MDYFDKQDSNKATQQQENYNHNQLQEPSGYHIQSKNVFPDNWKVPQDGDFDFVSFSGVLFPIKKNLINIGLHDFKRAQQVKCSYSILLFFCFVFLVNQLKNLDFEELQLRLSALDPMMEREIEELRQRYTAKRQPILDAMDAKKRRQQNFWGFLAVVCSKPAWNFRSSDSGVELPLLSRLNANLSLNEVGILSVHLVNEFPFQQADVVWKKDNCVLWSWFWLKREVTLGLLTPESLEQNFLFSVACLVQNEVIHLYVYLICLM